MKPAPEHVLLYATPEHACSYVDGRRAVTLFVDPHCPKDPRLYARLANLGFRRSGEHIYRPRCPACHACEPVRLPVTAFAPRRSHRRTWRTNEDLEVRLLEPGFRPEHFALYERYLGRRHRGGGMDEPTPDQFLAFLASPWSDTTFVEFRHHGALLAVAVQDRFPNGLSAVYSFYEPENSARSLGTYTILWQIAHARELGLRWLYLGYRIDDCRKMSYKAQFRPQQRLVDGQWVAG
jgi:arginine-tRNA-protein transferase